MLPLFGAICDYDLNEEDGSVKLTLRFKNEDEEVNTAAALLVVPDVPQGIGN